MTATTRNSMRSLGAAAIAIGIAGCSSILAPQPDLTKFYLLTPAESAAPAPSPAGAGKLTIGLGPIQFPAYLERPEIVTRAAPNRLELSKTDRWAEPLRDSFTQVLSRDLSARTGAQRMILFPWYDTTTVDLQVRIDVYRFETGVGGIAHLTADWSLYDGAGKTLLYTAPANIAENATPANATEAAAALSRAINDLSGEIAAQIARVRS